MFKWLRVREETKPIATDANRIVAKSSEPGEPPCSLRPTRADATPACSRSASIIARASIVMSLAHYADKLFNRVHVAVISRRVYLSRFRRYGWDPPATNDVDIGPH